MFKGQKTAKAKAQETHIKWLEKAQSGAERTPTKGGSPHPTVKVGALLVDKKGKEIACAANRFAHGLDHTHPERYENGSRSLWINCAEQMVLIDAARKKADVKGARLYVTLEPCAICAGLIVEAGIAEVVVPSHSLKAHRKLKLKWRHSIEIGREKLAEGGVRVTTVDMEQSS